MLLNQDGDLAGPVRVILETVSGDLFIGTVTLISQADQFILIHLDPTYHPFAAAARRTGHDFLPEGMLFTFDVINDMEMIP